MEAPENAWLKFQFWSVCYMKQIMCLEFIVLDRGGSEACLKGWWVEIFLSDV